MNKRLLALFVSGVATFTSLSFSYLLHWTPCDLCWYQRILMYPIFLLLGLSLVKKDDSIFLYVRLLSGLGFLIAAYHYAIQHISQLQENTICSSVSIPCTGDYLNWFGGLVTIPLLSMIAFFLLFVLSNKK